MSKNRSIIVAFVFVSFSIMVGSCSLFGDSETAKLRKELEELKKEKAGQTSETGEKTEKIVRITSGYLTLRDAPDTKTGKLIAKMPNGAKVMVGGCKEEKINVGGREGRWCQATYDGKEGWVFDAWLVDETNAQTGDKKEILWDFRKNEGEGENFSKDQSKAVLTYLFGANWDDALTISGKVSGSFTKPKANETLYYVGGCDEGQGFKDTSNCSHSMSWNAGWMAIYDGETPVMKVKGALGYAVGKVSDVNGDGINEIVSLNGFTNQGSTEKSIRFGQIKGGRYEKVVLNGIQAAADNFYPGYSDGCASGFKNAQNMKAAVVSYSPASDGKFPQFSEEFFQSKCNGSNWKSITKKEFEN